ncbi:MAG: catalase family protein [Caulobacterales bacterium]|jgi:hypothetical protein
MLLDPPANPIPYRPDLETPDPDEGKIGEGLREQIMKIAETTYRDGGHAMRGVHAKSHGLLNAELTVEPDLPAVLRQGMFAAAGRYPVIMRFSTAPGDILPDSVTAPRGLALKVFGVVGERLPGADGQTQDFVLVNGKTFSAPNGKMFLANLKMLAATTDKVEGLKKVISAAMRGAEHLVEAAGGQSATLVSLGGHAETQILGDSFFSQVPIRFGDYVAKVGVVPVSPGLTALTDQPLKLDGHPTGLRDSVVDYFADHGGEWELRVQLCTDLDDMPIENAAKLWPEDRSPYVTVARITAQPQQGWSEARAEVGDDELSFSPWHGLAAHRPLGSIMRLRKAVYEASAGFRREHNHLPGEEPRSFSPLADG